MPAVLTRVVQVCAGLAAVILALDLLGTVAARTDVPRGWAAGVVAPPPEWVPGPEPLPSPVCRHLVLEIQDGRLTGHYDLMLPVHHPIHRRVRAGEAHRSPRWFAHRVLGDVTQLTPPLAPGGDEARSFWTVDFRPPVILPPTDGPCGPAKASWVRIRTEAVPLALEARTPVIQVHGSLLFPDQDLVTVRGEGLNVDAEASPRPVVVSAAEVRLARPPDARGEPGSPARPDQAVLRLALHEQRPPVSMLDVAVGGLIGVDAALAATAGALHLVLLLLFLRHLAQAGRPPRSRGLVRVAAALTALPIGVGIAHSLVVIGGEIPADLLSRIFLATTGPAHNGVGVTALLVVAASLWWPFAALCPRPVAGRTPLVQAAAGLLLTVTVTLGTARPVEAGIVAGTAAVVYLGSLAMLSTWSAGPRMIGVTAVGSVLAVWCALLDPVVLRDGDLTWFGVWVFAAAAGLCLGAVALTGGLLVRRAVLAAGRSGTWAAGWCVVTAGCLAGLLAPVPWLLAQRPPPYWRFDPSGLVSAVGQGAALSTYLALGLLIVVLIDLRHPPADRGTIRRAGAVFVGLCFFWTSEQLFYLPVSLLAGVAFAYWVALPARPPAAAFLTRVQGLADRLRAEHRSLLEQAERPPGEGEADRLVEVLAGREAIRDRLRRIHLRPGGAVSGLPPEGGGLRHGAEAALIGALLGLPWVVVDLWLTTEWASDGLFLAFGLVEWAGWVALQWPIYGFFLGYFYPHLRGDGGLRKAATLLATAVLPPLVYTAAINQPPRWYGYGVWVAEMLLFVLLLGVLAGDRLILARAGLGVGHLLDGYQKRHVVAGAATVLLAEAGLLAALLAGLLPVLLVQAGLGSPRP